MFDKFKKKKQDDELQEVEGVSNNFSNEELEDLKNQAEKMDVETLQKHSKHYSEDGLWNKIKKYSKKAGSSAIYVVLLLYFVLQKEEVPVKSKVIIIGALGYFILPFDLIPDVAAGVGYTDDFSALIAALLQVSMYIDADIKSQAKEKLKEWFGHDVDISNIEDKLA